MEITTYRNFVIAHDRAELRTALLSKRMAAHLHNKLSVMGSARIELMIDEFLRFISLATKVDPGYLPISQDIDDLWHEYILETREYELLCAHMGQYIHHSGMPSESDCECDAPLVTDLSFIVGYVLNFEAISEQTCIFWPATERLMRHLCLDLAELNAFAVQLSSLADNLRVLISPRPAG